MRYFATIRYIGTHFHGFQVQPGMRTVQSELSLAMEQTLGAPCRITGCSRTDAGVHANAFCVTVDADGATVPPEKLPVAAIPYLPKDLSVVSARACREDFHVRYDVESKEYLYKIYNNRVPDPFLLDHAWHLPRIIDETMLARMREAALGFVGTHDFTSFMAEGGDVTSAVRTVMSFTVERCCDLLSFRVRADGFLYNMVRIMVGTLTEVAFGRIGPHEIPSILAERDRSRAGMTAPAAGLYLDRVFYKPCALEKIF